MKTIECIPNISEGKNKQIIDKIAAEVESVPNVRLLNIDSGASTNRTVYTFAGPPDACYNAAYRLICKSIELIDMRQHKGEHPRNGVVDVCPFVPIKNVTMYQCAQLAKQLGKKIADDLNIPVYLYESAATREHRRNLAHIRAGEYELLPKKIGTETWRPDFGPNQWNETIAKSGSIQIGARQFLIAYNINLNTKNHRIARRIARIIRQSGGAILRDQNGNKIFDENGNPRRSKQGLFSHCKARGWYIDEFSFSQVTINLTDYTITPLHEVFDKVCHLADEMGVQVIGSELIGLVPLDALVQAGAFFRRKIGDNGNVSNDELIKAAIAELGLSQIKPFDPNKRIIEYCIRGL